MTPTIPTFRFPDTGIEVQKSALLLAIDDVSFPVKENLCLHLSQPQVRAEPVLEPEPLESNAPDNLATHFYGTVLHDEGRFRMWYYACHWGMNEDWDDNFKRQLARYPDELFQGPLCYAESEDGIHWTKPHLGQVLFKGDKNSNALALPHAVVSAATLIKDESETDPARRYKMVYEFWPQYSEPPMEEVGPEPTCAMAVSPDGLVWTVLDTPYPRIFLEHASFYQHAGMYIVNSHNMDMQVPGESGTPRGRQGFARFSYDFENWIQGQVESFTLPEGAKPDKRGMSGLYDQVHLGIGAASFGTACVGLYGRWHNAEFENDFGSISCDLGLVISNNGLHFREPVKDHIFISQHDSPAQTCEGKQYNTNLCQANGILNVGDETRIYHGRWRNVGHDSKEFINYRGEVALATLPRDRWGSLQICPGQSEGSVWSAPIVLPVGACSILVNATGAQGIQIEIADAQCRLLPEYSGTNAGRILEAEGLDCAVHWPNTNLEALAGKTIRLKFNFRLGEHAAPHFYAASLNA